jgi:hypothetical protein
MASDIIVYCNDVYSSVRDAKNDDARNLVTIIRGRDGCTSPEASRAASRRCGRSTSRCASCAQRLEIACDTLRFTDAERAKAHAGAKIADDWNWGYQAWAAANELLMDTDPPREEIARLLTSPRGGLTPRPLES